MIIIHQVGTHLSAHFASIAPTASAPLLGFNVGPVSGTVSVLDFHGTSDNIIPGNISQSYRGNVAPHGATFSSDGFYYTSTIDIMKVWAKNNGCGGNSPTPVKWSTTYDGVAGMSCVEPYGSKCSSGGRVIQCVGTWGHTNQFSWQVPKMYPSVAYQFFAMTPKNGPDGKRRAGVAEFYSYKGVRGKSITEPAERIERSEETATQREAREARQKWERTAILRKTPNSKKNVTSLSSR